MKLTQQPKANTCDVQLPQQFKQKGDTSNSFNQNQTSHQKTKPIQKMLKNKSKKAFCAINQDKRTLLQPKPKAKESSRCLKPTQKSIPPKIQTPMMINEQDTDDEETLNRPLLEKREDPTKQYERDIIEYLRAEQKHYQIDGNYVKLYKDFNQKIRTFIIKYIFKIVERFGCGRKTLFLAVFCFDFYLAKRESRQMDSHHMYVVTAQAALHIAMKHEEIYPPSLEKFSDFKNKKEILAQEADILRIINFKLNLPSLVYFEEFFKGQFQQTSQYKRDEQAFKAKESTIEMICDLTLFDTSLYAEEPFILAQNIRRLVYNREDLVPFKEERVVLNIKWALERNSSAVSWLKDYRYPELVVTN